MEVYKGRRAEVQKSRSAEAQKDRRAEGSKREEAPPTEGLPQKVRKASNSSC
jgi:hypothetical protein